MNDLVAWLRAQLDEDERVARATGALHPWVATEEGEVFSVVGHLDAPDRCPEHAPGAPNMCDDLLVATGEDISDQRNDERAAHIARHDPARVLREVTAKRAIVDEHELLDPPPDPDDTDWPLVCRRCEDRQRHDAMRWPCPTLRHLASAYADRPGYREEWAP